MKKTRLAALFAALACPAASLLACTSLIAAPGATKNGGPMITYAADAHVLFGELYNQPAADHRPGTMRPVIEWDTQKPLGQIEEVPHTYATIGNMNEHGLTIAESTWGGRPELAGSGMIDYGSLIYITLQRAKTARQAIDVMTGLVDRYGYASSGESFSIADPGEVWIMELIGKGKDDPGAVWVARRVPDGHISGHANHSRIHTFPLDDPGTLYSKDVIDFAREKGFFEGKDKDFDFSRAYAEYDFGAMRGCDARVWSYFNRFAPAGSMDRYLPWITEGKGPAMPLWVKAEGKLDADDLKNMMRDHFEGTPLDMTKDIGAGPFDVPYRWRPMTYKVDGKEYTHERAIATQQTGFSFVADLSPGRPQAMKGILWFGTDDANTCVYLPVFNSTAAVPYQLSHGNGDMLTLSWDSNFWVNNYVANQAYNRYSQMIGDIRKVQGGLEQAIADNVAAAQTAVAAMPYADGKAFLQHLTDSWAAKATKDYKDLGDMLFVKYLDGNIKRTDDNGNFVRTDQGQCPQPKFGGYNERYFKSIADEQGDRLEVKEIK